MRLFVASALLSLAYVACGGDSTGLPPTTVDRAGMYTLRTVDGAPLPYAYPTAPEYLLTAESFTLNSDSSFTTRTDQQWTDASGTHASTISNAGTYSISGLSLTLKFSDGSLVGETFTGADEVTGHCCGSIWVYRR